MNSFSKPSFRVMDFMLPSLEEEAEEILSTTKQIVYKANNEIDVVAVYGGGSILMRPMIEERLQKFCSAPLRATYRPH